MGFLKPGTRIQMGQFGNFNTEHENKLGTVVDKCTCYDGECQHGNAFANPDEYIIVEYDAPVEESSAAKMFKGDGIYKPWGRTWCVLVGKAYPITILTPPTIEEDPF